MSLYTEKDLARVRHVFETVCGELLRAHTSQDATATVKKDDVTRCIDALLDALIELEVVEQAMRIEGNYPLSPEAASHLVPPSKPDASPDAAP